MKKFYSYPLHTADGVQVTLSEVGDGGTVIEVDYPADGGPIRLRFSSPDGEVIMSWNGSNYLTDLGKWEE